MEKSKNNLDILTNIDEEVLANSLILHDKQNDISIHRIISQSSLKNAPCSTKKMTLVANLIRGLPVYKAKIYLNFVNKKAAKILLKLLNSAIANGGDKINKEAIVKINIGRGLLRHRWWPRARRHTDMMCNESSMVSIFLEGK